jgi:anti-sigma factor RsiW
VNCAEHEHWLDTGRAEAHRNEAAAHVAGCAACAAAEAADRAIAGLLSQRFATAPTGFTEAVLARLPARRPSPVIAEPPDPYPWFVRMLLEPSTVLALVLGGVYALWAGDLWVSVRAISVDLVSRWAAALTVFPGDVAVAFAWLSGAILLFGGSYLAYRLADGLGARLFRVSPR